MILSHRVQLNPDLVFDYLTDMKKFAFVHPVITHIDSLGNERYLVHETLKFGLIPFSFTYPVTIYKSELNKTVIIRATVFKVTKIEMTFVLRADNNCTVIDEEISFQSPLPVKAFMQNIFRNQHAELFKKIELKEACSEHYKTIQ